MRPSFIPAGAWLKPDGTVDITVGGNLLEGAQGVHMQDALRALKRYAAQHGTLLMTTLHPDGQSSTDMVFGDGAVVQYPPAGGAEDVAERHARVHEMADLEDVFGLPPLEAPPAAAGLGRNAVRNEAFPTRPVFRPLGLVETVPAPVLAHAGAGHGGHYPRDRFHSPPRPQGFAPVLIPDLDLFEADLAPPLPDPAPPAVIRRTERRLSVRAIVGRCIVVVVLVIVVIAGAPYAVAVVQDYLHMATTITTVKPPPPHTPAPRR